MYAKSNEHHDSFIEADVTLFKGRQRGEQKLQLMRYTVNIYECMPETHGYRTKYSNFTPINVYA